MPRACVKPICLSRDNSSRMPPARPTSAPASQRRVTGNDAKFEGLHAIARAAAWRCPEGRRGDRCPAAALCRRRSRSWPSGARLEPRVPSAAEPAAQRDAKRGGLQRRGLQVGHRQLDRGLGSIRRKQARSEARASFTRRNSRAAAEMRTSSIKPGKAAVVAADAVANGERMVAGADGLATGDGGAAAGGVVE